METVLYKFKVKENKLTQAKKVIETLKQRKNETIKSLKDENTYIESIFFDEEHMYIFKLVSNLDESTKLRLSSSNTIYEYLTPALNEVLVADEKVTITECESFYNGFTVDN